MATSTFTYATQLNFKDYFPHLVSMSDNKNPIYNWVTTDTSNQYVAHNTGLVSSLFVDGEELGSAQGSTGAVDSAGDWYYDSSADALYYFNSASNPNDLVTESGSDWSTLMNNHLYRASMELNNMLDGRFSTPVQKSIIYSDDPSNDTPEYDAIIIKLTCYIVAVNLQRASGNWEDAEVIQEQITNIEKTGMVDKLNKGEWKLSFETDSTDKKGDIIEVTKTGTMSCVETSGEWLGKKYDRLQVICTTAGAYGTAMVTIKYSNEDALYGFTKENVKITGGLDYFVNGLYVRFEGASMSVNDRWDIEVRNFAETNSNSGVRSIDAVRNDLQPQRVVTRDRTFD
jgi:hypothetical protein